MATKKEIELQLKELEKKKAHLETQLYQLPDDPPQSQTQLEIEGIFKECMTLSETEKADPNLLHKFSAKVMSTVARDFDTKTEVSIHPSDSVSQARSSSASSTSSSRSHTLTYDTPYVTFTIAPNVARFVCFCKPNHEGVKRGSVKTHLEGVGHMKAMEDLYKKMDKKQRVKQMTAFGWEEIGDDFFKDSLENKVTFHA